MKSYLSIPHFIAPGRKKNELHSTLDITAFDKLDGSNIRAEFSSKKGFYKFGSRKILLDENSKPLGKAIELIQDTYAKGLGEVFKDQRWDNMLGTITKMMSIVLRFLMLTLLSKV